MRNGLFRYVCIELKHPIADGEIPESVRKTQCAGLQRHCHHLLRSLGVVRVFRGPLCRPCNALLQTCRRCARSVEMRQNKSDTLVRPQLLTGLVVRVASPFRGRQLASMALCFGKHVFTVAPKVVQARVLQDRYRRQHR